MPGVRAEDLPDFSAVINADELGGVVILNQPANPGALGAMKENTATPVRPMVAVDEEGGSVQRFANAGVLPSAASSTGKLSTYVEQAITEHGHTMHSMGVDIAFGPVVDVANPSARQNTMGDRAFSSNPDTVIDYGAATVRGWNAAGILPVLKHFPGHGSATGDTHATLAKTPTLADLENRDLLPYRSPSLSQQRTGVMVGHLDVPGLTAAGEPASISPAAINLLRTMGYNGLVFSDSVAMGALTGRGLDAGDAAVATIKAGADVAVITEPTTESTAPTTPTEQVDDMVNSLAASVQYGTLPEARLNTSVGRVLSFKGVDPCQIPAAAHE
jgi:beta-N-acetylhexosaminidase